MTANNSGLRIAFQSTLPRGSDTITKTLNDLSVGISIHAPSRERPHIWQAYTQARCLFQSTLPRGSDYLPPPSWRRPSGISIHAPSRERPLVMLLAFCTIAISIHAPSRERPCFHSRKISLSNFNPRSLAGATCGSFKSRTTPEDFNPRSLAGATTDNSKRLLLRIISIHAPSRERHPSVKGREQAGEISIHAPSRERPPGLTLSNAPGVISIHAPSRERPVQVMTAPVPRTGYFNPRSLAGATAASNSQSTCVSMISIHAPSRERQTDNNKGDKHGHFNPRSLAGATNSVFLVMLIALHFNPRSLAGATDMTDKGDFYLVISIHAPSRERQYRQALLLLLL